MADIQRLETALRNAHAAGDTAAAAKLAAALKQARGSQVSVGADMAMAAGSGLATGTMGLAGLAGDAQNLLMKAPGMWLGDRARELFGKPPLTPEQRAGVEASGLPLPTSQDVQTAVTNATGWKPYQPQTTAGQYVQTAAEFVPGAMMFGIPGGARGMVAAGAKYGVLPGVASEAAGQAPGIAGTAAEPVARVAGALIGGGGVASIERAAGRRNVVKAAPTADEWKGISKKAYREADNVGLVIENNVFNGLVDSLDAMARGAGHTSAARQRMRPGSFAVLGDMDKARAVAPTLNDMDDFRQVLGDVAREVGPDMLPTPDAALASQMIDKIDDFMEGLTHSQVLAGDPTRAVKLLGDARSAYRTRMKAQTIEDIFYRASLKTGANYTAAGYETALRQEFAALARNKARMRRFSPEERTAILAVVRGDPLHNTLRRLGKFAPAGYLSMVLSPAFGGSIGLQAGGPMGAAIGTVGVPALGAAAKLASTRMGMNKANLVDALVRGGAQGKRALTDAERTRLRALTATGVNATLPIR